MWGDIVARRRAWMKFDHFVIALDIYDNSQISQACADALRAYHHWDAELEAPWMAFFEEAAELVRDSIGSAFVRAY